MAVSFANKRTVRSFLIVIMMMLTDVVEPRAEKVNHFGQREQEIELKLKQPLKSIESSNGEIIDCISITKQPAFDHPMLKNHTIQMKPSSYPNEVFTDDNTLEPTNDKEQREDIAQVWQLAGDCPENTIPIKRITKEHLLRIDYLKNYGKKIIRSNSSQPQQFHHPAAINIGNGHEYAITYVENAAFHGGKATINVWKPRVQEVGEFSLAQIWVVGGKSFVDLNTLEAGSHACIVYPALYGDANPRLFTYWTTDGYHKTGCYNLKCSGFVQINKRISLGASLKPFSTYNGQQFVVTVQIWKDPKTGNWWLQLNEKDLIGYWPSELFPKLKDAANMVEWGGEVVNLEKNGQHTTTEMGSGHFSGEGFKKASYFKAIKIIDISNIIRDPVGLQSFASKPTCYDVTTGYNKPSGVFFFYGGPGRNPRCL